MNDQNFLELKNMLERIENSFCRFISLHEILWKENFELKEKLSQYSQPRERVMRIKAEKEVKELKRQIKQLKAGKQ